MDGPTRLPARTVGWFFPRSSLGWTVFALQVVVASVGEAIVFAPNPGGCFWGVVIGCAIVIFGMSYRYSRIREPWAHTLDSFEMATLQDARGRGAALVGMAILFGAVVAAILLLIFP